jgi:hypothetical protein
VVEKQCGSEIFALWVVTHRRLIVIYRRFGTPVSLIFKGQAAQECRLSRKSVNKCQSTLRDIPEEWSSHVNCGGNLISRRVDVIFCPLFSDVRIWMSSAACAVDEMSMEQWWNNTDEAKTFPKIACLSATLFIRTLTWTGLGSHPGGRGNRLTHDRAFRD